MIPCPYKWLASASLVLLLLTAIVTHAELNREPAAGANDGGSAWKREWAVPKGFSIDIDTEGYHYPTAIAFVPNPGDAPKDPLYFVVELRGTVKVVTNDRSIHTFAEGFLQSQYHDEFPKGESEFGAAGICLAPSQGYVFVTFAYQDESKTLRNNIIRFKTTPRTFSIKPEARRAFTKVFAAYESGPSHQIGNCDVFEEMLYVGVGDGFKSSLGSRNLDVLLGKIVRMDLDGKPAPSNPFFEDNEVGKARNYVWAYGLRNPFSIEVVDGHVLVTENGLDVDRFLEIERGKNYLWNGRDESIAANADYVLLDSKGPVQMGYQAGASFPKRFQDQFYVGLSSGSAVMRMPYGLEQGRMVRLPQIFLEHQGAERTQPVTGVAFGPDGLYFAPILPVRNDKAAIIKVKYAPKHAHAVTLDQFTSVTDLVDDGKEVMRNNGCYGCHKVTGVFELGGSNGPVLDRGSGPMVDRILKRISSKAYLESLRELDKLDREPWNDYREARTEVAAAEGLDKVRIWMKYQILEPRFDGRYSVMPDMGVSEVETEAIVRFLLADTDKGLWERLKDWLPKPTYLNLVFAFGGGLLAGAIVLLALFGVNRLRQRRA